MSGVSENAFAGAGEAAELAVVIVSFNSAAELPALIDSLRAEAAHHRLRVVVADNDSTDATLAVLGSHADVTTVHTGGNLGYAAGINTAMRQVGEVQAVLILNPDLRMQQGTVDALLAAWRRHPDAGVIAPRIIDDDGDQTFSISNEPGVVRALADALLGRIWKTRPRALSESVRSPAAYRTERRADWVTGAAMLVPREVAARVGEWDERFFLYSEETDFCRRVRDAGFEVWYEPRAVVQHSQGKSGTSPELDALRAVNRVRYMRKHAPHRAWAYRAIAWAHAALRSGASDSQRLSAAMLSDARRWGRLPAARPSHDARDLAHVVLTRFNLPSEGYESLIRAQEGWLRSRVSLFETYCLPSMRAQSSRRHAWIIYFDPESPQWLRRWIDETNHDDFVPIYRATVSHDELLDDIASVAGRRRRTLITTNLDNDDAVARDFLQRVQDAATGGQRTAIYLADGLIAADGRVYHRVDADNAFCSVTEPWGSVTEEPTTCWLRAHNRLGETMPVLSLRGRPAWLQVIHGGNVSNRVRGRLVSPAAHRDLFSPLLDGFCEPGLVSRIRDRFVAGPRRVARELARATAKRMTITLLGQEGIDRVKVLAARTTARR